MITLMETRNYPERQMLPPVFLSVPVAAAMRTESMGLPGRRVGEQAALGKADAVDQDGPEGEAD
jgi:hypothetical protein